MKEYFIRGVSNSYICISLSLILTTTVLAYTQQFDTNLTIHEWKLFWSVELHQYKPWRRNWTHSRKFVMNFALHLDHDHGLALWSSCGDMTYIFSGFPCDVTHSSLLSWGALNLDTNYKEQVLVKKINLIVQYFTVIDKAKMTTWKVS